MKKSDGFTMIENCSFLCTLFTYLSLHIKIPPVYKYIQRGKVSKKRSFSKLKGGYARLFFKHGDKMAGFFKTYLRGNGLDLHAGFGLQ